MAIGALDSSALNVTTAITQKVTSKFFVFQVAGLKPSTSYTLNIDGLNCTWAAKQFGKDMGTLISDSSGQLLFRLLYEFPYSQPYSQDVSKESVINNSNVGAQSTLNNYQITSKLMTLTGGGVSSSYPLLERIILTPGDNNTQITFHGH